MSAPLVTVDVPPHPEPHTYTWSELEKKAIQDHTARAVAAETLRCKEIMDARERGWLAQQEREAAQPVAGELPPLPEPASKWFGFPATGTDYFTKPQMIKAMRDVQFSQPVQQPAAE